MHSKMGSTVSFLAERRQIYSYEYRINTNILTTSHGDYTNIQSLLKDLRDAIQGFKSSSREFDIKSKVSLSYSNDCYEGKAYSSCLVRFHALTLSYQPEMFQTMIEKAAVRMLGLDFINVSMYANIRFTMSESGEYLDTNLTNRSQRILTESGE